MSTDRELMELAAKAAGYELIQFSDYSGFQILDEGDSRWWSPLTDDGDALRLAVGLGLTVNPYTEAVFVSRYEHEPVEMQRKNDDPYAATRRAIVRAAASIGAAL